MNTTFHAFALLSTLFASVVRADEPLSFRVKPEVVQHNLHADFCWFHPRVAAMPGFGRDGRPAVVMTIQKHLAADDHYSGMYFLRTDDLGATWTGPTEIPELAWGEEPGGVTISVADVTPGWHAATGKLIAIGTKVRYSKAGAQLLDKPRSHECAHATFDPKTTRWSRWKMLNVPDTDTKFFLVAPGCVQWLVKPDGTLLVPMYFRGPAGSDYSVTVLHCRFDGETLQYIAHGDELVLAGGRGLAEPSLAFFRGKYYLTLRNDARGYVSTSDDGLHFAPIRPWTFDDGTELGSYNTQQHWLVHSDGLFLAYTRRGANNDHIMRNRAPLFLSQVDPDKLSVVRRTEQVLIPERGVPLGNFGAATIDANESWVSDAEFILGDKPNPRGGDGSVFASRVLWSRPNRLVYGQSVAARPLRIIALGDSITKGVRQGVAANETFAAMIEAKLRQSGVSAEVVNLGVGSERTDLALARLDRDVIARKPDMVMIMYGTNDSYVDRGATDTRITQEQYRTNLKKIIEQLQAAGIKPVLMTEPRWGDAAAANGLGEHPNVRLERYMAACREVARETRVPLVDHFAVWSEHAKQGKDVGQWTTDQCHPNVAGHRFMAETILPVLRDHWLTNHPQPR